jgi:hypothetical protein
VSVQHPTAGTVLLKSSTALAPLLVPSDLSDRFVARPVSHELGTGRAGRSAFGPTTQSPRRGSKRLSWSSPAALVPDPQALVPGPEPGDSRWPFPRRRPPRRRAVAGVRRIGFWPHPPEASALSVTRRSFPTWCVPPVGGTRVVRRSTPTDPLGRARVDQLRGSARTLGRSCLAAGKGSGGADL